MKSLLSRVFAFFVVRKVHADQKKAVAIQLRTLKNLVQQSAHCAFGRDHSFSHIQNYADFVKNVPLRNYEGLKPYIERIKKGEKNVLWKGRPIYLSKTSGTTSGVKYIPITKESISNHINGARNALLFYIHETGKTEFVNGKMIFLQGSPKLEVINGLNIGRLSGIVAHHVPRYLLKNRKPSYQINVIEDWETKVAAIVEETIVEDMRLISGIPPWVQMYFELLLAKSGAQNIAEIFPKFSLLVYGGVNFKPYQQKIEHLVGKPIDQIELYPASEGFIAFQDAQNEEGMSLIINAGIFYEFVKAEEIFEPHPRRLHLGEVELEVNYAIIINSNAGLWGYNLGDTVKFVSLAPHRVVVTGRIKHFISAFGEHVIAEEVESAAEEVAQQMNLDFSEFHVAPVVVPTSNEKPYHEWLIELDELDFPKNELEEKLDAYMQKRNTYYKDLREGNVLQRLKVRPIKPGGFNAYMKSIGKLGGQNKLPRLANDRKLADAMLKYATNV